MGERTKVREEEQKQRGAMKRSGDEGLKSDFKVGRKQAMAVKDECSLQTRARGDGMRIGVKDRCR